MGNYQRSNLTNKHIVVGKISWGSFKVSADYDPEIYNHECYLEKEIRTFLHLILKNKDFYLNQSGVTSLQHQTDKFYININKQDVPLTSRQIECLTYLSMGRTMKYIANALHCSISNVENHLTCLKKKLGVYTTSGLIDLFWRSLL